MVISKIAFWTFSKSHHIWLFIQIHSIILSHTGISSLITGWSTWILLIDEFEAMALGNNIAIWCHQEESEFFASYWNSFQSYTEISLSGVYIFLLHQFEYFGTIHFFCISLNESIQKLKWLHKLIIGLSSEATVIERTTIHQDGGIYDSILTFRSNLNYTILSMSPYLSACSAVMKLSRSQSLRTVSISCPECFARIL